MATEREAKAAAAAHADHLRDLGAHSIGTLPGSSFGKKGFVVVANVPIGFAGQLPTKVELKQSSASVSVPVVAREMEPLRPERL